MGKSARLKAIKAEEPLKLDLGCGKNVREGFVGVDVRNFGQPITADLTKAWPWKDGTVSEAHCSHFLEHLEAEERIHFVNELYRVLVPEGKCQIIVPHWASCRAYGDMTHRWPPVSEFWFYYLNKDWREQNAPPNDGYQCNLEATWGYSPHHGVLKRNQEDHQRALTFF